MEQRTLEINLISAKDLKDVNLISKMDVYVVVSLESDSQRPKQKAKTPVDRDGGTHPTWNHPMKFTINEYNHHLILVFKLRCDRALGDKDIGEVNVPVKELMDSTGSGKSLQFVSYQVRKPSGKGQGELHFSYKFSDKVVESKVDQTVTAYPAAPVAAGPSAPYAGAYPPPPPPQPVMATGYGYPPPPQAYGGYPPYPPPPGGYGYPPPPPPGAYAYPPPGQAGYGYPGQVPVQQPRKKNNGFGMGLGAGLLGGALGGLVIGDMVSDAVFDGDCGF